MTDMMAEIAAFDGRMAKIVGPRSGQDRGAAARAAAVVAAGCAPEDIPHRDLHGRGGPRGASPPGGPPWPPPGAGWEDIAGRITVASRPAGVPCRAGTPEARAATGHTPACSRPSECNFFLEDMKTLGTPAAACARSWPYQEAGARSPPRTTGPWEEKDAGAGPSPARCHERHAGRRGWPTSAGATCKVMRALARDSGLSCSPTTSRTFRRTADLPVPARPRSAIIAGNPGDRARRHELPGPRGFRHLRHPAPERDRVRPGHRFRQSQRHRVLRCRCPRGQRGRALAADQREGTIRDIATVKEHAGRGIQRADALPVRRERRKSWRRPNPTSASSPPTSSGRTPSSRCSSAAALRCRRWASSALAGDPRDTNRARALIAYTSLNLLADLTTCSPGAHGWAS